MFTIQVGDKYEHEEYGIVEVTDLVENLSEAYITQTSDGLVFDGASVTETLVTITVVEDGESKQLPIMEFCEAVSLD